MRKASAPSSANTSQVKLLADGPDFERRRPIASISSSLVPGGYRIRALLEHISDDAKLFIVEPSSRLVEAVFSSIDCTDILDDPRVKLVVGTDTKSFENHLTEWVDWKDVTEVEFVALPNYRGWFPETHECLRDLV
jgi:hypothetical protein